MVDDRLEDVLVSAGQHLVIEVRAAAPRGLAPADRVPPRRADHRRRLLVAAVSLVVVAGAVVSVAPARRAVSGWLRAGGIDVSVDPDAGRSGTELPSFIEGATPIDPDAVADVLGQPPPPGIGSTPLGAPRRWWTVPEGGVVATWDEGATSLWIIPTDDHQSGMINKLVDAADSATWLPRLGDGGFAVSGAHVMQTAHRRLAAESAVAWQDGGLTFRLESSTDLDQLVRVAEALARTFR